MPSVTEVFQDEGLLAQHLQGYAPRPQQQAMAETIFEIIREGAILVAEAGTGTGKTLAYLVPIVLSGRKTLVSTATRTLQDQLFRKDLPLLRRVLGLPFKASLLKGRSNYLCHYRLHHHLGLQRGMTEHEASTIERIRRWATITRTGDIGELADVAEGSPLWPLATSTGDNCLGADCPNSADCHLLKARARAREADLVVINHHLLWADWNLRQDGSGELLPAAEVVVVDEAHQFVESASAFLGDSLRSTQVVELCRDSLRERDKDAADAASLSLLTQTLEMRLEEVRKALGFERRREAFKVLEQDPLLINTLKALSDQLERLSAGLAEISARGRGLEACSQRAAKFRQMLECFLNAEGGEQVRWFETWKTGFAFNQSPIEISQAFQEFQTQSKASWIFTSATLTHRKSFEHFTSALGLINPRTAIWDSPFDFRAHARLYIPGTLPDPSDPHHTSALLESALPLIEACQGRTFLLFTSHRALSQAASRLSGLKGYALFVQGTQSKIQLLEAFKTSQRGILLGSATFWEGVDVPGPTLSLVVIDKLPFASPGDPVLSARLDSLRQQGLNPFRDYQLPKATLTLKQGVGRLIRTLTDRGVILLGDPRILNKSYGRSIIESLPPLTLTQDPVEVLDFLKALKETP